MTPASQVWLQCHLCDSSKAQWCCYGAIVRDYVPLVFYSVICDSPKAQWCGYGAVEVKLLETMFQWCAYGHNSSVAPALLAGWSKYSVILVSTSKEVHTCSG